MKSLLILLLLVITSSCVYAQDRDSTSKTDNTEYAVVYTDCGSFGGFCIYYEDGTTEDYFKEYHIKKPSENATGESARVLLGFLKYMRSKKFLLVSSQHIYHPNQLVKTTEYVFSRIKK